MIGVNIITMQDMDNGHLLSSIIEFLRDLQRERWNGNVSIWFCVLGCCCAALMAHFARLVYLVF